MTRDLLLSLAMVLIGGVALAQTPASSPDDPLLTSASVRVGDKTRTVRLAPFRPVPYLKEMLPQLPPVNRQIVERLLEYPRTGRHDYWWPRGSSSVKYDGCTTDILLGDARIMKGESEGRTFCCGLTLEVFYRVLLDQPRLPEGFTTSSASKLKNLWFCREINSPGPEEALLAYGLGDKITTPSAALPGDFVQLWRANKSGHSVVFIAWAYDPGGRRVGLHYWSTQDSTQGIGFRTELFGKEGSGMLEEHLSVSRFHSPDQWIHPPRWTPPVDEDEVTSGT